MEPIPVFQMPEIAALVGEGRLIVAGAALSERFATFIEQRYPFLPVTGYSIDWSQVPGAARLRWDETTDKLQLADFLYTSALARHRFTAVWYGRAQPCVVGKFYFVAYNLQQLLPPGMIPRYLFGVDGEPPGFEPTFAHFAEYDGKQWLSTPPPE